jgi:hypothetical protein
VKEHAIMHTNYPHHPPGAQRAPLIALAGLALAGCSATLEAGTAAVDAGTAADVAQASAQLAAAQAMSATLATQAHQVTRLVDATLAQAQTWQAIAIMQGGALALIGLALIGAAAAVVIALARRPATHQAPAQAAAQAAPAPIVYIVAPNQAPMIGAGDAADWPERRARRRALAQLQSGREMTP